jgi:hypothetical protein
MTNVQFEEDFVSKQTNVGGQAGLYARHTAGGITGWMMSKGIIKEESEAKKVLLGIVVLNMVVTLLIVIYFL